MGFRQVFLEVSQDKVDKIPTNVKELLEKDSLPFNHIFGKSLRLAEPLHNEIEKGIRTAISSDNHELDFTQWSAYKKTDLNKKKSNSIGQSFCTKTARTGKTFKKSRIRFGKS